MHSREQLVDMIDVSAVKAQHGRDEILAMVDLAERYQIKAAFSLPSHTQFLIDALRSHPKTIVGGVVGFPSGGTTLESKVYECKQLIDYGCEEIDMVINIGLMKSGEHSLVQQDIESVVRAAEHVSVKAILECHYLTPEEIIRVSHLAADAGAAFVKTGTGWGPKPTTEQQVKLMSQAVDGRCQIKAAGGIDNLNTLMKLYRAGARRFGIGAGTASKILQTPPNNSTS